VTTHRYQVIDAATRAPEGDRPYLDPGRALMRVHWLHLVQPDRRYTLLPVRWRDVG
jgi:hypothetical protein